MKHTNSPDPVVNLEPHTPPRFLDTFDVILVNTKQSCDVYQNRLRPEGKNEARVAQ